MVKRLFPVHRYLNIVVHFYSVYDYCENLPVHVYYIGHNI